MVKLWSHHWLLCLPFAPLPKHVGALSKTYPASHQLPSHLLQTVKHFLPGCCNSLQQVVVPFLTLQPRLFSTELPEGSFNSLLGSSVLSPQSSNDFPWHLKFSPTLPAHRRHASGPSHRPVASSAIKPPNLTVDFTLPRPAPAPMASGMTSTTIPFGPLHLLFHQPRMPFLWNLCNYSTFIKVLLQCHLLRLVSPADILGSSTHHPLSIPLSCFICLHASHY